MNRRWQARANWNGHTQRQTSAERPGTVPTPNHEPVQTSAFQPHRTVQTAVTRPARLGPSTASPETFRQPRPARTRLPTHQCRMAFHRPAE